MRWRSSPAVSTPLVLADLAVIQLIPLSASATILTMKMTLFVAKVIGSLLCGDYFNFGQVIIDNFDNY